MKKLLVTIIACLSMAFSVNAQEFVSKNGTPILPKAGDYAIGIGAQPLFDFIFNALKINSTDEFSSSGLWDFPDSRTMSIFGKYFLNDGMALRGNLLVGIESKTESAFASKTGTTTGETVEDTWKRRSSSVYLSVGMEKRRGYKRLQGFYGCELSISLMGGIKDIYKYGNDITGTEQNPDRTDFNDNAYYGNYMLTEAVKPIFGAGLGTFAGIEYFIAPKISLGGQFQFGVGVNQDSGACGRSVVTYEYWDSESSRVKNETEDTEGSSSTFSFSTRNFGGQIFMLFYF